MSKKEVKAGKYRSMSVEELPGSRLEIIIRQGKDTREIWDVHCTSVSKRVESIPEDVQEEDEQ